MRPSFKEVPEDRVAEQSTCGGDSDGGNAAKPSALLEFLIRCCFDTDTPAPQYAVVRAILQAVGQGLGESEDENCDDGYAIAVWPFVSAFDRARESMRCQSSSGSARVRESMRMGAVALRQRENMQVQLL
jgi:hypothetical protein